MSIKRATKKPVTIEYCEFTDVLSAGVIIGWMLSFDGPVAHFVARGEEHPMRYEHELDHSRGDTLDDAPAFLVIPTLEGNHRADRGDRIIKGVNDEFYPCKPDVFAKTYDLLED